MREIFLSPHPDDAVWSCGGRIAALVAAGRRVVVVTCFSGDPRGDWAWLQESWRAIARPRLRRVEDERAVGQLGAELVTLGLPDAVLRGGPSGPTYRFRTELAARPAVEEDDLVRSLASRLTAILAPGDRVHLPLALGGHPDHRVVAAAFRRVPGGYPAVWYEDFPYPFRAPSGLVPRIEPGCDVEAWLAAAVLYRSQALALFGGPVELRQRLALHAARAGEVQGDRVWIPSALR